MPDVPPAGNPRPREFPTAAVGFCHTEHTKYVLEEAGPSSPGVGDCAAVPSLSRSPSPDPLLSPGSPSDPRTGSPSPRIGAPSTGSRGSPTPDTTLLPESPHYLCVAESDSGGSLNENGCVRGVRDLVLQIVADTVPVMAEGWQDRLWPLCWKLKTLPALVGGVEAKHLLWVADEWRCRAAQPPCRLRATRAAVREAFARIWTAARHAIGDRPIDRILELARARAPVDLGPHAGHAGQALQDLAKLCAELGAGGGEFFLACRLAGELLGIDYKTASRHLRRLQTAGLLQLVQSGAFVGAKAAVYRWRGELDPHPEPPAAPGDSPGRAGRSPDGAETA
jgi:hypothetical protein